MLADQAGHCAICPREPTTKRLHVDHDHKSGLVRGLLCWRCNRKLLPPSGDDPDLFDNAADYLRDPPAVRTIGRVIAPEKPKRKRRKRAKKP
jgi:hypothetical protein